MIRKPKRKEVPQRRKIESAPANRPEASTSKLEAEVAHPANEAKRLVFQFDAPGAVHVLGDRSSLERVLLNLADNAIRYTEEGKSIFFRLRQNGGQAQLSVSDEGIGISSQYLPNLFDRFYRIDEARAREKGGTGLGLAIVKGIVEAHKGTIDVQSEVGRGTTFTIRLPLVSRS